MTILKIAVDVLILMVQYYLIDKFIVSKHVNDLPGYCGNRLDEWFYMFGVCVCLFAQIRIWFI